MTDMMTLEEIDAVLTYYACLGPEDLAASGFDKVCDLARLAVTRIPELEDALSKRYEYTVKLEAKNRQLEAENERLRERLKKVSRVSSLIDTEYHPDEVHENLLEIERICSGWMVGKQENG